MARIYIIGIIYAIMFLNIPFVRDHAAAQVQIYKPKVTDTITGWGDKYTPALQSIITDLLKSKQTIIGGKVIDKVINNQAVDTEDNWSLSHKNSLTADQVDAILRDYGSPATGLGATITTYSEKKNIDNAYWLYMYIHESTAGNAGVAVNTKSTGNIRCTDNNCIDGFQAYPSWESGAKAHIDLLAFYRDELGDQDIVTALERWAPASENNQAKDCEAQQRDGRALSYPCGLMINVAKWRKANQNVVSIQTQAEKFSNSNAPSVSPTTDSIAYKDGRIMQIAYSMIIYGGFDAVSCEAWGFQPECKHWGTDIHVDADAPVFTPVDCTYLSTGHYSDPSHAGDYFMCTTYDGYEYYSGHLKNAIALTPGDFVPAGTIIGYGCTCVSGPHTHIQLRDPNGNLTDPMIYYNDRI